MVCMDKYLLTLSYRADGSSVFGENNKWGYFPSGSLAWRISQEGFLKDSQVITDLKLRVSYGITGNQGISPYGSLARLGSDVQVSVQQRFKPEYRFWYYQILPIRT